MSHFGKYFRVNDELKRFLVKELWEYRVQGTANIRDRVLSQQWVKVCRLCTEVSRDYNWW